MGIGVRLLLAVAAIGGTIVASDGDGAAADPLIIKGKPYVYDAENAQEVMRTCAGCHGEAGAGGGGGVYPRLGGLDADYLAEQIRLFKSRQRENIPMIPFAVDRELSERDVLDISRYLSEIKLETTPPADMPTDGFARLQVMKRVLQIPQEPGDTGAGKAFFAEDCGPCHGRNGEGRGKKPPLAGQHITYLKAQLQSFLAGRRSHQDLDLMRAKSTADWTNLWAYLSTIRN